MTRDELIMLQSLPLEVKILKTKERLKDAIREFGYEGLYLSFSGGKDSTVLHYILLQVELELWGEKRIPRVFCNTGLEYPELVEFALQIADVELRPEMTFIDVIKNYGYPIISKEQSYFLHQVRRTQSQNIINMRVHGIMKDGSKTRFKIADKYQHLIESDVHASNKCCEIMKKRPFKKYSKETGRIAIVGVMAGESQVRKTRYLADGGCNAFNLKEPQSRPIGFWTEQDIYKFILMYDIKIPSVYGEIVPIEKEGQTLVFDNENVEYTTTGCKRTGCVWCAYGCHLEKGKNRFEQLKETHPKLYDYCIRGGKHDKNGKWVPHKGLGMGYVLDKIGVKY